MPEQPNASDAPMTEIPYVSGVATSESMSPHETLAVTAPIRVLSIVEGTIVDGPGLRTSIYFAGCAHRCPGCHNPQSWDFGGGRLTTTEELLAVIDANGFDVTFTGGDPMYLAAQLVPLAKAVKERGLSLWCYTGFVYENIADRAPYTELLQYIDTLVDGPYVENLRDPELRFRGSSNQRIINLRQTSPPDSSE